MMTMTGWLMKNRRSSARYIRTKRKREKMGYTHYYRDLKITSEVAKIAKEIIRISGVKICGADGYGEPYITDMVIALNGDAEKQEDFESFVAGTDEWFCKTDREPYDVVVTAILTAAIYLQTPGSDNISSDGNISYWKDGIELFRRAYINTFKKEPDMHRLCAVLEKRLGKPKE